MPGRINTVCIYCRCMPNATCVYVLLPNEVTHTLLPLGYEWIELDGEKKNRGRKKVKRVCQVED